MLDVDTHKKIADLKELPKGTEAEEPNLKKIKPDSKQKVVIELSKDEYFVVSFKSQRHVLGLCLASNFNQDAEATGLQIGDELEVLVHQWNEQGRFFELIQGQKEEKKKSAGSSGEIAELKEGVKFSGKIASIKAQAIYVQLPKTAGVKQVLIGRLHMIECQGLGEFKAFAVGDRIECKVL